MIVPKIDFDRHAVCNCVRGGNWDDIIVEITTITQSSAAASQGIRTTTIVLDGKGHPVGHRARWKWGITDPKRERRCKTIGAHTIGTENAPPLIIKRLREPRNRITPHHRKRGGAVSARTGAPICGKVGVVCK